MKTNKNDKNTQETWTGTYFISASFHEKNYLSFNLKKIKK